MVVDANVPIPKNSKAVIISSDILGSKAIQLDFSKEKSLAQNNDTLPGAMELSITEEVTRQVAPIREKTENLLNSMDSLITVVHSILNAETQQNLIKSFESIKHTIQTLEHATIKVDTLVSAEQSRLRNIFSNVESISQNLKNNNAQISNIIKNFSQISDTLAQAHLAQTLNSTRKSLEQFSEVMNKVNKGKGSMGQLFNNDSLYNGLAASADNLNKLMIDFKENPKRYVNFSIFGGGGSSKKDKKSKKSEKVKL